MNELRLSYLAGLFDGKEILTTLLPFLIVKRKQAVEALTFELGDNKPNANRVKAQAELKERIHKLNHNV